MAEPSSMRLLAVVLRYTVSQLSHTDLVQLNGVELCAAVAQQLLGLATVWAVRLGEDGDGVLVDDGLDLGLCGGHCGGRGGAREEVTQEGNFGGCSGLERCEYCVVVLEEWAG